MQNHPNAALIVENLNAYARRGLFWSIDVVDEGNIVALPWDLFLAAVAQEKGGQQQKEQLQEVPRTLHLQF